MPQINKPWDTLHLEEEEYKEEKFDDDAWQTHFWKFANGAMVFKEFQFLPHFIEYIMIIDGD